ncbi:MAG: helix-turn-helix domain-containing protein [Synergistaceae bacterium]|nr:helix-turn-helix domain-containing protein [Synergistaceae bacterium]MBQ3626435.1 helix-turn-helix domain-containing protein [Synergistaceae bacterium]MBQ6740236.1 helix-turn-helix domain-containing protein [Synergistaceae bacterium]MBQ6909038.1 helix-turn-helix domain-containing protein [Synergistaceae bacterium]MBQ9896154.1 helix-turn-helix domain-containing protein [Synergistaceae bacterium]
MERTFDEFLKEQLQDPKFREEYEALAPDYSIIQAIFDAQDKFNLSIKDVADRTGISKADISKIINGNANPSLRTLKKLAKGLNMKIKLDFEFA